MAANDPQQWGIIGSLILALLAVARFLLRWEKTFSDAARDEITALRMELGEMRSHIARCEAENTDLRRRVSDLEQGMSTP